MTETLNQYMEQHKQIIQEEMRRCLSHKQIPNRLREAMLYSTEAGGKRLRPILLTASCEAYDDKPDKVIRTATALEMIHTYSLIHDDLPAMDNDDYRRGQLTNHRAFDEATAILAGDALLTYSFEIVAEDPLLTDTQKATIIRMLTKAGGPKGMVAGQALDMEAEAHPVTLEELEDIHAHKTGELISFAVKAGAYIGGATDDQLEHLHEFAHLLGLIFQVQDDILDVIGDEETLGKPIGSDQVNHKSTYPELLGLEGAKTRKTYYVEKAKTALKTAGAEKSYLMALTDHFSSRDR